MRPGISSSLYEYLIIGIVLQNATVRRSIQMFKALLEHYGTPLAYDGQRAVVFLAAGRAGTAVSEDELRALKVGYRAKSIKRVDDAFAQGLIDEIALRRQDQGDAAAGPAELYGVGPATVWYLLFDVFHHWDLFNHISPWEQKIYSKLFFDRDPKPPSRSRTCWRTSSSTARTSSWPSTTSGKTCGGSEERTHPLAGEADQDIIRLSFTAAPLHKTQVDPCPGDHLRCYRLTILSRYDIITA